jgi:glycerophosphoryl diester phosphodiesterase
MPRRVGHRGARGHAAENTIASFERAIELGCDEIETDVWLTDRGLIVSHDPPARSAELTLEATLDACAGRVTLNVEVKAFRDERNAYGAGARVASLIAERGVDAYMSSFWWPALDGAREHGDRVRRAYIYASYAEVDVLVARARAAGLWALHPNQTYVTPELVAKAHAAGLAVNAWTANDPADIAALVTLGVDGICSDFPERVPKG